ncbi:DUF5615 family PIN-like protein [Iamia sp.]|uniref:DUF5615 family PIN-like protein n=1 Tax=Iamia sp. TaxID=2722710 RepID=UPI0032C23588
MRFLIDECLSTLVADLLRAAGHNALHLAERNLLGQPDEDVMAAAVDEGRVLVSADTDFGELLASRGAPSPASSSSVAWDGCRETAWACWWPTLRC